MRGLAWGLALVAFTVVFVVCPVAMIAGAAACAVSWLVRN